MSDLSKIGDLLVRYDEIEARFTDKRPTFKDSMWLINRCRALEDAVQWMSGSDDFAPGGKAHEGWLKLRSALSDGEKEKP